ncbi:YegS/Rv2252/BmrU family lipid kinase [Streptomonospora sp. S1-112]|uniref:YegS/Rv2252/BmrU family lipid kinase n=1 Tax=Streptomonospora mangrovi TaxID=2883123 RepID=A0A9X3SE16_9ACTN|nr:YegS/Rv2252/BmrU family lipid kinase [Streptomonospora mangrovi]MDA0563325.1 YegS/Rv2252/BmrU family lipid kinase [Streptomonospora mangrovi]
MTGGGEAAPRTVTLLANPVAGGRRGAAWAAEAARRLLARGIDVDLVAGRDAAESRARARACVAAGSDVLAVAGGDGMVHLAVQELAGSATALAVLPTGTGNDFARALGIPAGDPAAAAAVVAGGRRRRIDVGVCTPSAAAGAPAPEARRFATVLTSGFDSFVNERANRMAWPRGRARYAAAVLAELGRLRPRPFTVIADGRAEEFEAVLVAVGNTGVYGGGMRVCPHALPDDGLLSVTVVGPATRAGLLRAFPRIYRGSHATHPLVRTFHARTLRVEAPDVPAFADGEPVGALPLAAEAAPAALEVVVPRPRARPGITGGDGCGGHR